MTSSDDPQGFFGGRAMKPANILSSNIAEVPFNVDTKRKVGFANIFFITFKT